MRWKYGDPNGTSTDHLPQVNVLGVVNVTRAALPCLRRSPAGATNPGDTRGHLINITSAAGICAVPFADAWCRCADELVYSCLQNHQLPSTTFQVLTQDACVLCCHIVTSNRLGCTRH
jgi:hypothetical protein